MGLDMYLTRTTYVKNWNHTAPEKRNGFVVTRGGEKHPWINPERIAQVMEQVCYWRKANAIHRWFVQNVQGGKDDCGTYEVTRQQLVALLERCQLVKESPDAARELLPSQSGFFFGNTEYGIDYTEDIESTIKALKPLLDETTENQSDCSCSYHYRSSW